LDSAINAFPGEKEAFLSQFSYEEIEGFKWAYCNVSNEKFEQVTGCFRHADQPEKMG
jgi:hypothetical protein